MPSSMTGFGRGVGRDPDGEWRVEAQSVNGRFLEVTVRLPWPAPALGEAVRRETAASLARGRVEVRVAPPSGWGRRGELHVDKGLALKYYRALKELQAALGLAGEIEPDILLQLPEVFVLEQSAVDADRMPEGLRLALSGALEELVGMRRREGERLAAEMLHRIHTVEQVINGVAQEAGGWAAAAAERLRRRLAEEEVAVEPRRLAEEVALWAQRGDITEELTRLGAHAAAMRSLLEGPGPLGRQLEFLLQEAGREVNTLGAKAPDAFQAVVAVKAELEKLREQAANLE